MSPDLRRRIHKLSLLWLQGEKDVRVPDRGLGLGPMQLQLEHKPVVASGATASLLQLQTEPWLR